MNIIFNGTTAEILAVEIETVYSADKVLPARSEGAITVLVSNEEYDKLVLRDDCGEAIVDDITFVNSFNGDKMTARNAVLNEGYTFTDSSAISIELKFIFKGGIK